MLLQRIYDSVVRVGRGNFSSISTDSCGKFDFHFQHVSTVNTENTWEHPTITPQYHLRVNSDYVTSSSKNNTMFSKDELLSLRKPYPIKDELYQKINNLGIVKHRRGRRGGTCMRKHIATVQTNRSKPNLTNYHKQCNDSSYHGGVNLSNLVQVNYNGKKYLDVHLWNARSNGNKTITIHDYLLDHDIDVFVIVEAWTAEEDPVKIGECVPSGYSCFNFPRQSDKHGGIAIFSKSILKLSIAPTGIDTTTFEHASITDNTNRSEQTFQARCFALSCIRQ